MADERIEAAARILCRRGVLSRAPFDVAEEMLAAADAAVGVVDPQTEPLIVALKDAAEMLDWSADEHRAALSALNAHGCDDDHLRNCADAAHNAGNARDRVRAALAVYEQHQGATQNG